MRCSFFIGISFFVLLLLLYWFLIGKQEECSKRTKWKGGRSGKADEVERRTKWKGGRSGKADTAGQTTAGNANLS
ncbi:hypothetical protein DW177_09830 [Blautia sp. AM16-16B]|nr:hypothetical protein DW177_09830 [Blautia sp. AM16-16B]